MKHRTVTRDIEKTAAVTHSQVAAEETPTAACVTPCEDRIRDLAHQKWQAAGCLEGDGVTFWLEAERELAAQTTQDDAQPTPGEFDDTVRF